MVAELRERGVGFTSLHENLGQTRPRPCPSRFPAHPSEGILPARAPKPSRPAPAGHPAHTPPRRPHSRQNRHCETQNEEVHDSSPTSHRLKIKLLVGLC
jgi:hypothetical protein